jgi:hypothetical protein
MSDVGGVGVSGMTGAVRPGGWGLVEDPGHEQIRTFGELGGVPNYGESGDKKTITEEGTKATGTLEGNTATGQTPAVPAGAGGTTDRKDLPGILDRLTGGERGPEVANDLKAFIDQFKGDPKLMQLMMKLLDVLMGKGDPMGMIGLINEIKAYLNSKVDVQFPQHEPWNAIVTRPDGTKETVAVPPGTTSWPADKPFPTNSGPATIQNQSNYDPLKITLDGTDAKLNTTDHTKIRMEDGTVKEMSGGLNDNEAWLVKDRDGLGVKKDGVVDGEDVFGDHMGKFKNAYDQLAQEYAGELKTDAQGNKYIDLKDPNSVAAKELKLMDKGGNLYTASEKLNKIYVSYAEVNKTSSDGLTAIKQEGLVEYKDNHTAKSVDQWFSDIATSKKAA